MFFYTKSIFLRKYLFLVLLIICVSVIALYLHASNSPNATVSKIIDHWVKGGQPSEVLHKTNALNQLNIVTKIATEETNPAKDSTKYVLEKSQISPIISKEMLIGKFDECLKDNFTIYDYMLFGIKEFRRKEKKDNVNVMFETLFKFSVISNLFKIETFVIDPFVLFCMLPIHLKKLLMKRNLKLDSGKKASNILSLGVFNKDAAKFEKKETMASFKNYGFEMEFIHRPRLNWMHYDNSLFISHIFLRHKGCIVHVVVFHQRSNYLWHSSIMNPPNHITYTNRSLYFISEDSAYENFTAASLSFKSDILKHIKIPSRPAEFLFQLQHSRFLECNTTVVEEFKSMNVSQLPSDHSRFSITEFNEILGQALQELKSQLDPLFLRFWIWSGTMLGWYRQCDVIPYTGDIDFGAWSSDVDDLNKLLNIFLTNELLQIQQKMGLVDEGLEFNLNCKGIRVDIFFLQKESNGTWYAGHRPSKGYYFKYHHPNFSLCSADLLGHKVLVPCETESVIATEYGPEWMKPVSSWNYESSIWNRGPNIYWDKTLLDKVYSNFYD